jgi:hypothetical protein
MQLFVSLVCNITSSFWAIVIDAVRASATARHISLVSSSFHNFNSTFHFPVYHDTLARLLAQVVDNEEAHIVLFVLRGQMSWRS